jgi:hypothetical protein
VACGRNGGHTGAAAEHQESNKANDDGRGNSDEGNLPAGNSGVVYRHMCGVRRVTGRQLTHGKCRGGREKGEDPRDDGGGDRHQYGRGSRKIAPVPANRVPQFVAPPRSRTQFAPAVH